MDILVIGNGFDLAHGLPTKYTDFLEFAMVMRQVVDAGVPDNEIDYGKLLPEMVKLIKEKMDAMNKEEWKAFIYDNLWVKYFLWNPLYQKENWIDFESEISRVIRSLENDMFSAEERLYELTDKMMSLSNEFLERVYSEYTYAAQSVNALTDEKCESITFKEIRDRLYNDLNKLIRALEIYLSEYVGNINIKVISPDIQKIAQRVIECKDGNKAAIISDVLCFNYTDTYQKIYLTEGSLKNHIDYIHGKADISNTIESNNMVLGIDEYLPDERKNRDIDFIAFKKFYQRIHKETGCKYKEWVDDIREEYEKYWQRKADAVEMEHRYTNDSMQNMMNRLAASAMKDERCRMHNLYFFGHSLDVTDGDILRELILNDNVYTTIYYLNKDIMGQQIANLVKVIGQDELIKRTGGSTKTIEFRMQQDMLER